MTKIFKLLRRFQTDTGGATAIEYAMIAATMALALLACLPLFSTSVGALFAAVVSAFG
jgi:Flp pilus assembly pilin Flp